MTNSSLRSFLRTTTLVTTAALATSACIEADDADLADLADRQTVAHRDVVVSELAPPSETPPPAPLVTDGTYQLASTLDVEAQALLPGTAYQAVQLLEGLRDRPAQTLFALAEDAGVPYVDTLLAALPSALESRLYGWIDGYVQGVTTGDGTIAQVIDTVLTAAQADVAHVELASTLTLAGGAATHRLDTITLEVQGRALSYDVAPLAGVGVELEVPVTAAVGDAGALSVSGHGFGVPYGKLAWRAIEDQVRARYGADLRGLLGRQVDCPAMAASVARRCVLGVCVGHEAELRAICEAGLDEAVAQVRSRVEAATVQPLALDAGAATMYDGAFSDGVCSSIEGGVWTARLDTGHGLRPAPATFTGARQ
ncbi:MAG: hypothetical protein HS111_30865 [Kofleriaceae bacterium]|nr:hypothetical protein [Kofleriaceae bacterium]MCL4228436.1 hypothetical protein [Myxococcales bacterium]